MEKITIRGKLGPNTIDLTIEATTDGKACAKFVAAFYEGLMDNAPDFMARVEKALPTLLDAARKLANAITDLKKKFTENDE